jgi:hypothetical protein
MSPVTHPIYIITEGKFDAQVIENFLQRIGKNDKVKVSPGNGFSAALSKALSLANEKKNPIILVLDTNSSGENSSRERRSFVDSYLNINADKKEVNVVWADPELETIFFGDKDYMEAFAQRAISDDLWTFRKSEPRRFWHFLTGGNREKLLDMLNDDKGLDLVRQSEPIKHVERLLDHFGENIQAQIVENSSNSLKKP